jgi:two-component system alkaline phosphatase synthesis response regulator PhoP
MSKRILLVEDEEELCMTIGDRLRSEGYAVDFAGDGIEGSNKVSHSSYDLIILDIMLPLRSGLELCTEIRRTGITTPILFLTARSQTVDKVVGLRLGADDYLSKPFDTLELMARIEALLRRAAQKQETGSSAVPHRLEFGGFVLDTRKTELTQDGKAINLTAKEYQLLRYFAEHPGITISREELLLEVWGHKADTFTRTVDMHVASLRQKLEQNTGKSRLILTVQGFGYKLQLTRID